MAEEGERKEEGVGLREESEVTCDKEAVVQLLSCVHLFVTPWAAACQAPLPLTSPEA